ncbi:hypothetical protein KMZ93_18370 [Bradyrhizobium sediminis]|uniref:DUF2190 family protein n=1 Tax=Bradyrhizobium sediminis TaxID=2840469 RepID=A0A975RVA6_9BRAD|nr:hypothetical protein [Bradyrhizobium sediminis]QWG21942.1 hypothetical protein KMZ93_18370 [Bradyrhizobium sediminis]
MSISKDLFSAILSMDSYNRGYNSGIALTGTTIGKASIAQTSSILLDDSGQSLDLPAGFYAIAYNTSAVSGFSAGEKTIAYRGTAGRDTLSGVVPAKAGTTILLDLKSHPS